jgi:hypothetical protein
MNPAVRIHLRKQLSESGWESFLRLVVRYIGKEPDVLLSRKKVWIVFGRSAYIEPRNSPVLRQMSYLTYEKVWEFA